MPKMSDLIPVTDLRQDAAAALRRVRASKHPVVITQRGRTAAVMLSVEAYERAEQEREILRLLARGEREIRKGKGHDHRVADRTVWIVAGWHGAQIPEPPEGR